MSYFEYRQLGHPEAYEYLDVTGNDEAEREASLAAQRDLAICRAGLIAHDRRRCWTVSFVDTTVKPPERREVARLGSQYEPEGGGAPVPNRRSDMENQARVRVAGPGEVLSIVPLLLGYEPGDGDLVTLGMNGAGRVLVTARLQAKDVGHDNGQLWQIFRNFHGNGVESTIVVGYGSGEIVTPAVDKLVSAAAEELAIRDALRVEGNRYWSYTCTDPECCPVEGREFDRETEASTTLRAQGGLDAAPSREALTARIAAPTGERAEAARQAWERAARQPLTLQSGRQAVRHALESAYGGRHLGDDDVARLARAMQALPVRDDAWSRMSPERADEHLALWTDVVRRTPDTGAAAPASMLAFCAWQKGDGALANVALERAVEAKPGYSLASLLQSALSAGLPPSAALPPMTPDEVEQSYRELARQVTVHQDLEAEL